MKPMGELPPKLFFRIGEVAGLVGVEPHVLRYWEREFRSIRPTKSAKGQRVYSRKDVENLRRVRDLLYRDGFTIAGAKKKLQLRSESIPSVSAETDRAPNHLNDVEATPWLPGASPMRPEASPMRAKQPARETMRETAVLSSPFRSPHPPRVREKLVALRSEIEAFLAELSSNGRRP